MPRMPHEQVISPKLARVATSIVAVCVLLGLLAWLDPNDNTNVAAIDAKVAPPQLDIKLLSIIEKPDIEPWGVSPGPENGILVTCHNSNDLLLFSLDGSLRNSARKTNGPKWSGLLDPNGVAYDPIRGRIYVADSGHGRVVILDTRTFVIGELSLPERAPAFQRPVGVAVRANGSILVVDVDASSLFVFSNEGKFVEHVSGKTLGMSRLWDICCLDNGSFVLSSALGGVTIYDADYKPKHSVAARGVGPGHYLFTTGVASDNDGLLYVCAKTQGKLMILDHPTASCPQGTTISEILSLNTPDFASIDKPMLASYGTLEANVTVKRYLRKTISFPMDVTVLSAGKIALAERGNHRIVLFSIERKD